MAIGTPSQTRQVVRAFFAAWTQGDIAAAGQYLADDLIFSGTVKSLNGASAYLGALEEYRRLVTTGNDLVSELYGDEEATLIYLSHTLAGPIRMAEHFHLTAGKISSLTLIFDPTTLFAFKAAQGQ